MLETEKSCKTGFVVQGQKVLKKIISKMTALETDGK